MKRARLARIALIFGGIMELVIAIQHFTWPFQLVRYGEYAELSKSFNELVLLFALAVGLLIMAFAFLSFYFAYALADAPKAARVFGFTKGVVWFARAMMEIALPVTLPIFFLNNPTVFIVPGAIILSLLYLVPMTLFKTGPALNRD